MANASFRLERPANEPVLDYAPGSPEKARIKAELEKQFNEVSDIPVFIDGKEIRTGPTVDVTCPHNHEKVIAKCHQASKEDVTQALNAAISARAGWAALPWNERVSVFLRAADLLATKWRASMNAATMLGQSKTIHQAEIDAVCELIDFFRFNAYFATQIYRDQPASNEGMWNRSESRGLEGFVYAVSPFNFSSIAVNLAAAPALMGCTVLWKPAPTSMLSSWIGMQILREAGLPAGVINMVPGDPATVSEIVLPHPDLAGIHFTGSTPTFNYLWKEVGNNISRYKAYPRLVGETGGKDFVFAHQSANVDELVCGLIRGAFEYQGQKCSAASRAYIPASLWPDVKEKLIQAAQELKVGDVQDFTNFMGAVIDKKSFSKVTSYIEHAKESDEAQIIAGGEYSDKAGYFIDPTIIVAKKPHYKSMIEEIFGPILTVFVYDDDEIEKVLDLCDTATPYALTGAIYAKDRLVINHLTERLRYAAGNFYINDKPTGAVVGQQPFGGGRASGTNDKAGSVLNLTRWISQRTLKENFFSNTEVRYPFMDET